MTVMILFLCLSLAGWAQAADVIGVVDEIAGPVTVVRAGKPEGVTLSEEDDLFMGDLIRTGEGARARIVLTDDSAISLSAKTELLLTEHLFDSEKKSRSSVFSLLTGKIKCFVNDLSGYKHKRFEVQTPTAVMGVRGTVFLAWMTSPEQVGVCAMDHIIDIHLVGKPEQVVAVGGGDFLRVKKGVDLGKPERIPGDMLDKIHEGLFPKDRGLAPANKGKHLKGGLRPGRKGRGDQDLDTNAARDVRDRGGRADRSSEGTRGGGGGRAR
jgi:hypothetical protein